MSQFYFTANAIAAKICNTESLASYPVVVARQKDLTKELQISIGKTGGKGCFVVAWAGSVNEDTTADGPKFVSNYVVLCYFKPVLRPKDVPADEIVANICTTLHDWRRTNATNHFQDRLIVTAVEPVEDPELLVYAVRLQTTDQL